MEIDPANLAPGQIYSLMIRAITPRPIAWVSTCTPTGEHNLAPFSYFNGVCSAPPALAFSPVNLPDGSKKHTLLNIEATGQFVVNLVPYESAETMHQTSAPYPREISELAATGLTPAPASRVKPPRVLESPVQFECETIQIVPVGSGPFAANLVIGHILQIHVDDSLLDDRDKIDPERLDSVGRMGGLEYCRTRERFSFPPATVPDEDT